ncbi:hypothetical protein Pfo_022028 [Paulownia fortunei]|nr:hypothetical protein Pfo_022028 [Paulownia fortunei]
MERQHQILRDEAAAEKQKNEGKRDGQQAKKQAQLNPAASAPPSASSSPSHEFSFTISLHPPTAKIPDNKTKTPPPFAIDLSPADEIFFHGHLLPLHLLAHLPVSVSPRSSTNSPDSFTLPIKELQPDDNIYNKTSFTRNSDEYYNNNTDDDRQESSHVLEGKGRGKSKSFSLFGMPKWRKGREQKDHHDHQEKDDDQRQKKKSKFDMVKRYMRLVKPFLSFRNRRGNPEFLRQPQYSYKGNFRVRSKKEMRGRRSGEFSAPASMRTSPTNSGLLVASGTVSPTKSDSTMEELQAAIQAAIAHCKKSIEAEDKIKLP